MKKKLYLLTIATALTLSMTACGNKAEETQEPTDTTVVEVANLESTIVEETPVTEPTVVEEPTIVEEVTSSEEEEEPTIVEEDTSSESDVVDGDAPAHILEDPNYGTLEVPEDYEWYVTDEEMNTLTISDIDYIKGVYEFLSYHNPEFIKTEDVKYKASEYVRFLNDGGDLLALVNKDFSKAYDIIEECGIDVTTDEGKLLKASEMRAEVVDYDTFWEQFFDIIDYGAGVGRARGVYTEGARAANRRAEQMLAEGVTVDNAVEAKEVSETINSNLAMYDKYTEYIDGFEQIINLYDKLTEYLH